MAAEKVIHPEVVQPEAVLSSEEAGRVSSGPWRFSTANRRRLSGPGLRTFLAITELWGLGDEERQAVLGGPPEAVYRDWVTEAQAGEEVTLDVETLVRVSAILGIHHAMQALFAHDDDPLAWLRGSNRAHPFNGQSPLAFILGNSNGVSGPVEVRGFLDALQHGQAMAPNEVDRDFRAYTDEDIVFT